MIRLPPRSTRTDTLFPYTTLFRSSLKRRSINRNDRSRLVTAPIATPCRPAFTCNATIAATPGTRIISRSGRSEEHTSELQSLIRTSYAVFCLKKKTTTKPYTQNNLTLKHNKPYSDNYYTTET